MEILVILMLALCLFAVAMFIVFFVMLKKRHQEKFNQNFDDVLDDDDDDEVLPSEKISLEKNEEIKPVLDSNEALIEEPAPENIIVPIVPLPLEEDNLEELVNILINQKNYIFLANGNTLQKGEQVKLVLNNKIYSGVITKANYQKDIKDFKIKPKALVIAKDSKENISNSFNEDLMPKKKVIKE